LFSFKTLVLQNSDNFCSKKSDTIIIHKVDSTSIKNFVLNGIVEHQTDEMISFKKKYGVGFNYKNCVVNPISYKNISQNNQKVAKFLSKKFGNSWLNELPVLPFGIKK